VDDWEDEPLPVNAYLVEHTGGRCLFDTGQTAEAARAGYFPAWHPFLRLARFELGPSDEVSAQLEYLGVPAASVDHIVLSHLHTDHVGGLAQFPDADVVVGEIEWRRARGLRGSLRGYVPRRWPDDVHVRTVKTDGPPLGPFAGRHDLLGDGRLVLVPTPGHTPGHLSMVVFGDDRTWFLAGDLVHHPSELEAIAPGIARWCETEHVEVLTAHDEAALR
jgi:glyoxylase-like metal-dependent hydrolase (beta-lactamase superfamily II)